MKKIKPGRYRHFKGGLYEVIGIGKHSETLKELVIYKNCQDKKLWLRPVEMFVEEVEFRGEKIPRFKKAD